MTAAKANYNEYFNPIIKQIFDNAVREITMFTTVPVLNISIRGIRGSVYFNKDDIYQLINHLSTLPNLYGLSITFNLDNIDGDAFLDLLEFCFSFDLFITFIGVKNVVAHGNVTVIDIRNFLREIIRYGSLPDMANTANKVFFSSYYNTFQEKQQDQYIINNKHNQLPNIFNLRLNRVGNNLIPELDGLTRLFRSSRKKNTRGFGKKRSCKKRSRKHYCNY